MAKPEKATDIDPLTVNFTRNPMTESGPNMNDSGERRTFPSGAVRDRGTFKPRPDLASPHANLREGAWLARGAEKYKPRNWEKGMPISECVASLVRHLEAYKLGQRDEDHMAAIRTNAGFILHYEEEIAAGRLSPDLDDMPHYVATRELVPKLRHVWENVNRTMLEPGDTRINPVTGEREVWAVTSGALRCSECGAYKGQPHTSTCNAARAAYEPTKIVKPFMVYLCGPITGRREDYDWRAWVSRQFKGLKVHIETLDPLRGKSLSAISNQGLSYLGELAVPKFANRDKTDIQLADAILAHFPYEPPRQSIGSWMEMGAAAIGMDKPVILATSIRTYLDHLFCRNFCQCVTTLSAAVVRVISLAAMKG
jgi:hypothetical protein